VALEGVAAPPTPRAPARFVGAALPLVVLCLWEIAARDGLLPRYLPAPSSVALSFWGLIASGDLVRNAAASLFRALSGFVIGAAFGAAMGLLAGVAPRVERFYEPLISLTYPVPKIAVLPIIFAWFGLGDPAKIVVIVASVFYPVYIAAFYGAKATNRLHIWSAQNMGARRLRIFAGVIVPSALPQLFYGLRIGLAIAFVVMFTAELIAGRDGLGYLIASSEDGMRFDMMWAALLAIGVLGFGADRLLLLARQRVLVGQLLDKEGDDG
jgi:ABC-type nitrate/sulfonate/bicarbonate transport system permease component